MKKEIRQREPTTLTEICPYSGKPLLNPVRLPNGDIYEEKTLIDRFSSGITTNPTTEEEIIPPFWTPIKNYDDSLRRKDFSIITETSQLQKQIYAILLSKKNELRKQFEEEGIYIGELNSKGEKEGVGSFFWMNKERYYGFWANNKMHGMGILIFYDVRKYEGQWENGSMHGKGTMQSKFGYKYEGGFRNNEKWGYGIESWEFGEGDWYEGDFKENKKNGIGMYCWQKTQKEDEEDNFDPKKLKKRNG